MSPPFQEAVALRATSNERVRDLALVPEIVTGPKSKLMLAASVPAAQLNGPPTAWIELVPVLSVPPRRVSGPPMSWLRLTLRVAPGSIVRAKEEVNCPAKLLV